MGGETQQAMTDVVVLPDGATLCSLFQATVLAQDERLALRTADGSVTVSWREYGVRVERAARGLAALGVRDGDTVGMMLTNRPEFHILDLAALHLGAIPFAVYNTSSPEQIQHMLANADCRVLVCEEQFREQVAKAQIELPALEHVIVVDENVDDGLAELAALGDYGGVELDFTGRWRSVTADRVATIIYTSGTTGPPKGVELTHANLIAAWDAMVAGVPALARRGRYVSYLPIAHLADRVVSHYPALVTGSEITCVPDPRAAIVQLGSIRPTMFLAVPRIWEKLKAVLETGLEDGLDRTEVAQLIGLADADLLLSGAAPIHADVLRFYASLGMEICEAYGMTESCAATTLNLPGRQRFGTVGGPLPGVEMMLADDGEVLFRGGFVMNGYRHDPQQTAEAIDRDGWLHTGDIGRLDEAGYLCIVDRKKELIINAAGKNMSPQNIEAQLKAACPLIAHAVAIGDGRPYNTALLVLDPDALAIWAPRQGLDHVTLPVLAHEPRVRDEVDAAVREANSHLSRVEQIKRFTILDHDWAPGGEELTPTLKPKRRVITIRYAAEIDAMYDPSTQEAHR